MKDIGLERRTLMRVRRSLALLLALILLLVPVVTLTSCGNGSVGTGNYSAAIKEARDGVWKEINAGLASGGQAAILVDGEVVYSEAFGMADREKSEPVTTDTLFNSGSVSKTYCAAAVMKLVDDGKVKLDSPVVQYLPEFKMEDPRYKDITVRMLLNHQSGLPGTTAGNDFGYAVNPDFYSQVYENLSHSHLKADPGFAAPYCNDGFTLAEMMVAKVSGRKYIDYVTDEILAPLGLTRTGVSIGARPDARVAAFYEPDSGKKVPAEAVTLVGAGGLSSTAEELVRFGDSFSKGGPSILSPESIDEMTKADPSTFAKDSEKTTGLNPELAYGLGLDAVSLPAFQEQGIKVIIKGGDTQDFHSELMVVPDKRIAVAVMEAGHGSGPFDIAESMLTEVLVERGLMKEKPVPVTAPPVPEPLPAGYESFSGLYDSGGGILALDVDTEENTVTYTGSDGVPGTLTYYDESLHTADGSATMNLISVDGQTVLLKKIFGLWMTAAQKIPPASDPRSLETDVNGVQWLRRNAKQYESMMIAEDFHVMTTSTDPALPGYVVALGSKIVESPTYAGMTSKVIRDLTELNLVDRGGQTWLQISDLTFSPTNAASPLNVGRKSVKIEKDGYNQWLKAAQDIVLDVKKPKADRLIVFGPDGQKTYDSVIDSGKVFVPAGSFIELAGSPGDSFAVSATAP